MLSQSVLEKTKQNKKNKRMCLSDRDSSAPSSSSRCGSSSSSSSTCTFCCPAKRRAVTTKTVDKWILEHNKTFNTSTWLEYERADQYHVATLRYKVCTKIADKLRGSRSFNPAYIEGSSDKHHRSRQDGHAS